MAATHNLHELVNELPTEERKQLYNRIRRSLSLQEEQEQKIYHSELPKDRRNELIQQEMGRLGLWQRFVFWLMRVISRKSDEDVFLSYRLRQFRTSVRHAGELVDFEERLALPELARRAYAFYRVAYPIIPMFRTFWKSPEFLQEMISYLLERRIPNAKTDLTQFVSMKEMQDLFMRTENKQAIRKEVSNRLDDYLKSLQPDLFTHLEDGVLPLYFLKNLCLFPFGELFRRFGVDIDRGIPDRVPDFKPAFVVEVVDLLEQLYYGVYAARRVPSDGTIHQDLIEYYVANAELDSPESAMREMELAGGDDLPASAPEPAPRDEAGPGDIVAPASASTGESHRPGAAVHAAEVAAFARSQAASPGATSPTATDEPGGGRTAEPERSRVAGLRSVLRNVRKAVDDLLQQLQLVEIIKYVHEDPYYRFLVYMPRLDLREYYSSSLTAGVLAQADRRFADVRMGVIGRMITQIFRTEPPDFEHYRPTAFTSTKVPGIPAVRYVKSLNILYNYIRLHYFGGLQDYLRELVQIVSARYRDLQTSLQFHASALEDLAEKIRGFDLSFSTDSDEGKTLVRLRTAMEKDPALQRTYRITIAQKDRDARTLVDKGNEHIQGIQTGFQDLVKSADQGLMQRLATVPSPGSRGKMMDTALMEYIETFGYLRKLLNQLVALEEGY